jgi:hypothetical protein
MTIVELIYANLEKGMEQGETLRRKFLDSVCEQWGGMGYEAREAWRRQLPGDNI